MTSAVPNRRNRLVGIWVAVETTRIATLAWSTADGSDWTERLLQRLGVGGHATGIVAWPVDKSSSPTVACRI